VGVFHVVGSSMRDTGMRECEVSPLEIAKAAYRAVDRVVRLVGGVGDG